jgi:hypothetical protein
MTARDQALAAIAVYSVWLFVLFLCLMFGLVAYLRGRLK